MAAAAARVGICALCLAPSVAVVQQLQDVFGGRDREPRQARGHDAQHRVLSQLQLVGGGDQQIVDDLHSAAVL